MLKWIVVLIIIYSSSNKVYSIETDSLLHVALTAQNDTVRIINL